MRIVHHSIPRQLAASRTGAIGAGRVHEMHSAMSLLSAGPSLPRAVFPTGDAHA